MRVDGLGRRPPAPERHSRYAILLDEKDTMMFALTESTSGKSSWEQLLKSGCGTGNPINVYRTKEDAEAGQLFEKRVFNRTYWPVALDKVSVS